MARQLGIIKLKGTLDNVSFYKTKDGHLARMKTSVDGNRIASDPAFVRTRENNKEFGSIAKSGKEVREALRPMMQVVKDVTVSNRLMKVMAAIKNLDPTSVRGDRNVAVGIQQPGALDLLKGFNFNKRSSLDSVLFSAYSVNTGSGDITISSFTPINDLRVPSGATHVSLTSGYGVVDFATGAYELEMSPVTNLLIDGNNTSITLTPANIPTLVGTSMFVLLVEFFQEVNGVQYSLKNGAFNSMAIVDAL